MHLKEYTRFSKFRTAADHGGSSVVCLRLLQEAGI